MNKFVELRHSGLLWYLNRVALHPHGLALALHFEDDADPDVDEPIGWSIMVADDGIWSYTDEDDDKGKALFDAFQFALELEK